MKPSDLLMIAEQLATNAKGKPKQAELKRAASTTLFHTIAYAAANLFAGGPDNLEAWRRIYRALEHGSAKSECQAIQSGAFSDPIKICAASFVRLPEARHKVDYDPLHKLTRADVRNLIGQATKAIHALNAAPAPERRRFAAHLLFWKRG